MGKGRNKELNERLSVLFPTNPFQRMGKGYLSRAKPQSLPLFPTNPFQRMGKDDYVAVHFKKEEAVSN